MSKKEPALWPWLLFAGMAAGGGILVAFAASQQTSPLVGASKETWVPTKEAGHGVAKQDIEAAARMLASENPRGSEQLHIEQIWTQIRSQKGSSLYDRITAGSGYGEQGEGTPNGGIRPVATTEPATDAFRLLARAVLEGQRTSILRGAKRFFEPRQQDLAFAKGEAARKKRDAGKEKLSAQELRFLKYRRSASQVRAEWLKSSRLVGEIDGVEFYT